MTVTRRLAAGIAADVVSYSRLIAEAALGRSARPALAIANGRNRRAAVGRYRAGEGRVTDLIVLKKSVGRSWLASA